MRHIFLCFVALCCLQYSVPRAVIPYPDKDVRRVIMQGEPKSGTTWLSSIITKIVEYGCFKSEIKEKCMIQDSKPQLDRLNISYTISEKKWFIDFWPKHDIPALDVGTCSFSDRSVFGFDSMNPCHRAELSALKLFRFNEDFDLIFDRPANKVSWTDLQTCLPLSCNVVGNELLLPSR